MSFLQQVKKAREKAEQWQDITPAHKRESNYTPSAVSWDFHLSIIEFNGICLRAVPKRPRDKIRFLYWTWPDGLFVQVPSGAEKAEPMERKRRSRTITRRLPYPHETEAMLAMNMLLNRVESALQGDIRLSASPPSLQTLLATDGHYFVAQAALGCAYIPKCYFDRLQEPVQFSRLRMLQHGGKISHDQWKAVRLQKSPLPSNLTSLPQMHSAMGASYG